MRLWTCLPQASEVLLLLSFPRVCQIGRGGAGLETVATEKKSNFGMANSPNYGRGECLVFSKPFLRRFIPGRVELVAIMKKTHDKRSPDEACYWDQEKDNALNAIKAAIAYNAMAPPDGSMQYYLAMDASQRGLRGALFQLHSIPPDTEANNSNEHKEAERIIQFMSFRLCDAECRYTNPEREALAVVRGLAET